MLFLLLGLVILVGVVVLFVVVGIAAMGAKSEHDALRGRVVSGDTSALAAWSPDMLAWLSKDAIGSSLYHRPMGGAQTSRIAVTVPACQGGGMLMALTAEHTPRHAKGTIAAVPAAAAVPEPATMAASAPAEIILHVETAPAGARVLVDGVARGTTPAEGACPGALASRSVTTGGQARRSGRGPDRR